MKPRVAVIGAGVSGLTCGVLFAERGYGTTVFAREAQRHTTSAAAAAIWFPYDAEPADLVTLWSLATDQVLRRLAADPASGVAVAELRVFARAGELPIPSWAGPLGATRLDSADVPGHLFTSGYAIEVPIVDTTIYLDYLAARFVQAGGQISPTVEFSAVRDVPDHCGLIVNCAGVGAASLVPDADVEPHRGQVAVVAKLDLPYAIVCDDPPLMYCIPRRNDCVLGGTNELSENLEPDAADTARILAEVSHVLGTEPPRVLAERVGLRPYRRSGVRLEREWLSDGRMVIHNYGHGGSGFTLSWGCAEAVFALAKIDEA